MSVVINTLIVALFVNAFASFFIAFFWQAKVILTILGVSDWENAYIPWKALSNKNGPQNNFFRFVGGEIFPVLRRKWLRAIAYVVSSYVTLFAVVGLLQVFAPEFLG